MNQHISRIISEIKTKDSTLELKQFDDTAFYNKYFGELDLTPDELSPSINTEFRRRMKIALEDIANTKKTLFIALLILTPFAYFFGSIFRDWMIDYNYAYPGSFSYIGYYVMWIVIAIFIPISYSILNYSWSEVLRDFIKLEFANQSSTIDTDSPKINSNSKKTHKERLIELEALLAENLISADEYKLKKKEILKDL
jgi:hypothetical protein